MLAPAAGIAAPKTLSLIAGFRRFVMTRSRSRKYETRLRILMCLTLVAVVQPNLVWCVQSDGPALVELAASSHPHPSSDVAFPGACIGDPFSEHCDGCLHIPISFLALSENSSATDAALIAKTAQCVTLTIPCKNLPLTRLYSYISSNSYPSDRRLTDISSTILLI